MREIPSGVYCAAYTPVSASGALLEKELRHNLTFLRDSGAHGIMAMGSTGNFASFSTAERRAILEVTMAECGSMSVIANISHVRLQEAVALGKHAAELGAEALAVLPPWFYPISQADIVEFFVQIGQETGKPLLLYNFPERTGSRLELETIAAICDRTPVVALKHSGADWPHLQPLIDLGREKGYKVLVGMDTRLAETMRMGAEGVIGGLVNISPAWFVEIFNAAKSGTWEKADLPTSRIRQYAAPLSKLAFPLDVAAAMEAAGLPVGESCRPLSPVSRAAWTAIVSELRPLFQSWGLQAPRFQS